jgi:hypothetical protein
MLTILGAGGAIGNELVKLLAAKNQPFRLVGRNPKATPGATETLAADLTDRDQTVRAVALECRAESLQPLQYPISLSGKRSPNKANQTVTHRHQADREQKRIRVYCSRWCGSRWCDRFFDDLSSYRIGEMLKPGKRRYFTVTLTCTLVQQH